MRGIIFLFLALLITLQGANAISVASDYLTNSTMELIAGDSKLYGIRLQNPSDEPTAIKLDYDSTFIKIVDYKEVYALAPKETGLSIFFNVTAPKQPGTYEVGYTVSEVEPSGEGLPIRLKISKTFNLRAVKDPNKFYVSQKYVIYSIMVLAFLFYIFKSRNAKKSMKKQSKKAF